MAIVDPMSDVYGSLLVAPAVFTTTEHDLEMNLDTLLTKSTSKRDTEPLVRDHSLEDIEDPLLEESDDLAENDVIEELPIHKTFSHNECTPGCWL